MTSPNSHEWNALQPGSHRCSGKKLEIHCTHFPTAKECWSQPYSIQKQDNQMKIQLQSKLPSNKGKPVDKGKLHSFAEEQKVQWMSNNKSHWWRTHGRPLGGTDERDLLTRTSHCSHLAQLWKGLGFATGAQDKQCSSNELLPYNLYAVCQRHQPSTTGTWGSECGQNSVRSDMHELALEGRPRVPSKQNITAQKVYYSNLQCTSPWPA